MYWGWGYTFGKLQRRDDAVSMGLCEMTQRENGWRKGPGLCSGAHQCLEKQRRLRRSKPEKPERRGLSWKNKLESRPTRVSHAADSMHAGPISSGLRHATHSIKPVPSSWCKI